MNLTWMVRANSDTSRLDEHASQNRERIRAALSTDGAVVFRGFDPGGVEGFAQVVRALSGEPLPYSERSSPRTKVSGNVYTSTEYPANAEIFFHNENSYQSSWPMSLFFRCVRPPMTHGATPLADTRQMLRLMDGSIAEEFRRRGYLIVRNFGEYGLPWREVFGTSDRSVVDSYCAEHGITTEWIGDRLRTKAIRQTIHRHPETGDEVWFNHVALFHLSTHAPQVRAGLLQLFDEPDLPTNTYFGDGGTIGDDVMDHVRGCYRKAATRFDYQLGDVVMLDNMLTAHAREPYTGERRIEVAMAESYVPARLH